MAERRKIAFVVNPKAGKGKVKNTMRKIERRKFANADAQVVIWEDASNGGALMEKLVAEKFDSIVAVGGDGTVNEIGKKIIHTNISLGIIPCGSGNGLARHLGIPLNPDEALSVVDTGKTRVMDCGMMNGRIFFCTSGTGFDAHIGKLFASSKTRGFMTYAKITLRELLNYKPEEYVLQVGNETLKRKAFLITFANAGQWGNNAWIAPGADVQDGKLDVCVLKPFPWYALLSLVRKVFRKNISSSRYYERYKASEVKIERMNVAPVHCDGEPFTEGKILEVKIIPKALKGIVS